MTKSMVISQQDNHDHLCSNPILLCYIGQNGVPQKLGKLQKGPACL